MKKINLILVLALVGLVFSCSQDGLIDLTDDTPEEVGEEEEEEEEMPLDTFGTLLLFNNNTVHRAPCGRPTTNDGPEQSAPRCRR